MINNNRARRPFETTTVDPHDILILDAVATLELINPAAVGTVLRILMTDYWSGRVKLYRLRRADDADYEWEPDDVRRYSTGIPLSAGSGCGHAKPTDSGDLPDVHFEPYHVDNRAGRRWLRSRRAAKHLGVGESTLAKLRCYGGGPPFVKLGNTVIYDIEDLDAFAEARKVRNTSDQAV